MNPLKMLADVVVGGLKDNAKRMGDPEGYGREFVKRQYRNASPGTLVGVAARYAARAERHDREGNGTEALVNEGKARAAQDMFDEKLRRK